MVAAVTARIVAAYGDRLSAHQPHGRYPDQIELFAREVGATALVAGATPAMCDGVTQGQRGMGLSLFSCGTIALSAAVGLSHGMFDGAARLGICDKIVPGLIVGALRFGHLPTIPIPAGPVPTGIANPASPARRSRASACLPSFAATASTRHTSKIAPAPLNACSFATNSKLP